MSRLNQRTESKTAPPVVTVLCVDDCSELLALHKALLESRGYRVLTASTGRHGLELAESHPVSAVVTDYEMPQMDGGALAAELKRENHNLPVLMLSGCTAPPRGALAHVDQFVNKGQAPDTWLSKLAVLLAAHQKAAAGRHDA